MSATRDTVAIINRQRRFALDREGLQAAVAAVLDHCGEAGQEVSVVLVSDRTMRQFNRDYRGRDEATDVLSFAMREGAQGDESGAILGDLVISLETVVRQSGEPFSDGRVQTGTAQRELALMTIHGLLHLMGYDHEGNAAEEAAMIAKENELFALFWEAFPSF